jgi:hypothetical protein
MIFKDKHVFLISSSDIFFNLYADALVKKCNINPNQILIVVFKSDGIQKLVKQHQFQYIEYDKKIAKELSLACTITSISLISRTAEVIKEIHNDCMNFWQKYHLLITDDEVDRWQNNLNKENGLVVNEKNEISKDVLFVLFKVENFIVTEIYFKQILQTILRRDNFNIVNASIIFDILPTSQSEKISDVLVSLSYPNSNRILLGSKGFGIKDVFKFLWKNHRTLRKMQIVFFPISLNRRIIIDIYLFFLRIICRTHIDFIYLSRLNAITYNVMVASCSYFVLQDRGGGSTARLYAKWGCGRLLTRKGSPNDKVLSEVYNINCLDWEKETFCFLNTENEAKIILDNSENVLREENRSIQILRELYSIVGLNI